MADAEYIATQLGGIDVTIKRVLTTVFRYLLTNLRFGHADNQSRAENMQAYFYRTTTPAVANTEFSIAHGLGRVPYLAIPVLPLDLGAQFVRLSVSRAPDASRLYLKSPEVNAPVTILVEG